MNGLPLSRRYRLQRAVKKLSGLVAYYPLDEIEGTVARNYAPANRGSLNGTINGATVGQPGKVGKAYSLDGVNDDVDFGNDSKLVAGAGSFSFGIVAYVSSTIGTFPLISRTGSTAAGYDIFLRDASVPGAVSIRMSDNASHTATIPSFTVTLNAWHLIIGTINRTTNIATMIIDGVSRGTVSIAALSGSITNSQNPKIGNRNGGFAIENIQHALFANRVIAIAEALKLAKVGRFI